MSRQAREVSSSAIYHVMVRGIDRMRIFLDDEDRVRYLNTIRRMGEKEEYEVFAYCLMDNHVHLLLRENQEDIQRSMKRVSVSYAYYFNHKYHRVGHLFQDRFRSEAVEGDPYFLSVGRYIHNNPVKAGIVHVAEEYPWSSYPDYVRPRTRPPLIIRHSFLLNMLSNHEEHAVRRLREYTQEETSEQFMDDGVQESGLSQNDDVIDIRQVVKDILMRFRMDEVEFRQCKDYAVRNQILREMKVQTRASNRELSDVLGLGKDIIQRA